MNIYIDWSAQFSIIFQYSATDFSFSLPFVRFGKTTSKLEQLPSRMTFYLNDRTDWPDLISAKWQIWSVKEHMSKFTFISLSHPPTISFQQGCPSASRSNSYRITWLLKSKKYYKYKQHLSKETEIKKIRVAKVDQGVLLILAVNCEKYKTLNN